MCCNASLRKASSRVVRATTVAGFGRETCSSLIPVGWPMGGDDEEEHVESVGAEDALGDMDFKVAGTRDFVTALQLDTKLDGIPADVLASALLQAREAGSDPAPLRSATTAAAPAATQP